MSGAATGSLRVIRSPRLRPSANMAMDAALLEAGDDIAARIYGWEPPGLSIGWFQDLSPFRDVPGRHEIVRRPTGGGAIYHDDELTFALAGPTDKLGDTESLYVRIHDTLVLALRAVGVAARRIPDGPPGPGARALRSAWCFEQPARHDVVAPDGRKLAGSAQRRTRAPRSRVLLHGSLVLRRPDATPFCAAVADQADPDPIRETLESELVDRIAAAFGLAPRPGMPTAAEAARAEALIPAFTDPELSPCRTSTRC